MNYTVITLLVVVVAGLTKLFTYLLSDKRRRRNLIEKLKQKEKEYAEALARNDTVAISLLHDELYELRKELTDSNFRPNPADNAKGGKV